MANASNRDPRGREALFLVELGPRVRSVRAEQVHERREKDRGYNAEYIFAATYGLTDKHVPAALKVRLVPVTLVMDVVFLPGDVVAGCFGLLTLR